MAKFIGMNHDSSIAQIQVSRDELLVLLGRSVTTADIQAYVRDQKEIDITKLVIDSAKAVKDLNELTGAIGKVVGIVTDRVNLVVDRDTAPRLRVAA